MSRAPTLVRRTALAVLIALAAAAGCGTADTSTQTSVYLEIYDGTVVLVATEVTLDVIDPAGGQTIGTLQRSLPQPSAQTSATAPLGSVVILAGADGGVRTLRISIKGQRAGGGAIVSTGTVDVALEANRQVRARLTLVGAGTTGDAGALDAADAADAMGAHDAADTRAAATDTGPPPVDARTPPVDAGTDSGPPGLALGDNCSTAAACGSGFCVDGVCCDSDCAVLCHACNLTGSRGTCTVFPAGSQCVPATCNANDALIPARTCDGNGNCGAAGTPASCGNYRCQTDACLRSCTSGLACIASARCTNNRCL